MSLLYGKLEGEVEIKSSAESFHHAYSRRPHHLSNMTPEKLQGCTLHEGEFGKSGSILTFNYVHDGKAKVAKDIVEKIDDEKKETTLKVIGGDLLDEYKSIKIMSRATPKEKEGGSVVHWTLEYEKLHENIPEPNSLLELLVHSCKDMDEHLEKP